MKIQEALDQYKDSTFEYGTLDCCMFAANIVRDMTGIDPAADLRGKYSTPLGAARLISNYGGLRELVTHLLGEYHPVWSAKVGDLVYINPIHTEQDAVGEMIGVYDGSQVWYLTDDGLISGELNIAQGCWNV